MKRLSIPRLTMLTMSSLLAAPLWSGTPAAAPGVANARTKAPAAPVTRARVAPKPSVQETPTSAAGNGARMAAARPSETPAEPRCEDLRLYDVERGWVF